MWYSCWHYWKGIFLISFSDYYLLMYTENTVESFVFISLDSLIVVFNFFPFLYFRIFRAHTCTASPLISVMCAKNFCPFICLLICCNIEFVWTMLGLCCKMEVARTSGLQSAISYWPLVDLCRILVGGSLLVPCSLPGPPVVRWLMQVFSLLFCLEGWVVTGSVNRVSFGSLE